MTGDIADRAPSAPDLTDYDRAHLKTYLRLLDAHEARAEWREVAQTLLGIDPGRDPDRARLSYETHLARAQWLRDGAYKELLQG